MKKKHLKEIQRINKLIPKEMLDRLMKKQPVLEVTKEIITRALQDAELKTIPLAVKLKWWNPKTWFKKYEYKTLWMVDGKIFEKEKYQAILDSGSLDVMEDVVNPETEKEINSFLEVEFEKARKLGRLPPPQKMPTLKSKSKQIYVQQKEQSNS